MEDHYANQLAEVKELLVDLYLDVKVRSNEEVLRFSIYFYS